jgi:hypothetical protein
MPYLSFPERLSQWQALSDNLLLHQSELPGLVPSQEALTQLIVEGRVFAGEQDQLEGARRDSISRRVVLEQRGIHLREYIAAALRKEYGVANQRLVQFGIRPRILRRRPSPSDPEPPGENPAPPPSDS